MSGLLLGLLLAAGAAPADAIPQWKEIYAPPSALAEQKGPFICVLDTEHPETIRKKLTEAPPARYKGRVMLDRARAISGLPCVLVHYSQTRQSDFDQPQLKAIVLMARAKRLSAEIDQWLFALIRETRVPMIGFCGGAQMMAQAYGGAIDKMRPLRPGETDPHPQYFPGDFKEWGFMPVSVTKDDPLFARLGPQPVMREMHSYHITKLPQPFEVLASSAECKVQVIKHHDRLLYGTQFHPEAYDDAHPDGRTLLENFFRLAGAKAK